MSRKKGVIYSYILTIVEIFSSLIYTPILISSLGQAEYGIYILAFSITTYLTLLDLGVGNALVRYISKYRVQNNQERLNQFVGITIIFYGCIALIVAFAGTGLIMVVPVVFAKGLSVNELRLVQILLLITLMTTIVQFLGKPFGKALIAFEKFSLAKVLAIITILIRVPVCLLLLKFGYRSISVIIVNMIITVVLNLYYLCYSIFIIKIRPKFSGINFSFIKEIVSYSSIIFLQMIATQLNSMVDQVLIGALVNASSLILGVYGLGIQVTHYYQSFAANINGVLMPGVVKLVESNATPAQLQEEMVRVGRYIFMVLSIIFMVFLVFGKEFLNLWAGNENQDAYYVAIFIMFPMMFSFTQSIGTQILWAKNKALSQAILKIIVAVINIGLTIVLIKWNPLFGAAIGTGIALLVGDVVVMNIVFMKYIQISMLQYYKYLFRGIFPCLAISLLCGLLLKLITPGSLGWSGFLINCFVMSVIYLLAMIIFGLNTSEKKMLVGMFKRIILR